MMDLNSKPTEINKGTKQLPELLKMQKAIRMRIMIQK